MAIEFSCSGCQQQLRVSDDSVGKSARCPKCGNVVMVPAETPAGSAGSNTGNPFGGGPAEGASPFAAASAAGASLNPYASPQAATYQPPAAFPTGPIINQVVGVEHVFNYAWQIWQLNMGLLVGITVAVFAISMVFSFAVGMIEFALLSSDAPPEAVNLLNFAGNIVSNLLQLYLGIGEAQIVLKLARRQPATFGDLFAGGRLFLPVLGVSILLGLAIFAGLLLLIVPGIILALMWWPAYYLVVDEKTGIMESFSVAATVTKGNWGTAFVLWLLSIVVMIIGFVLLCVGVLFAAPLVSMIWAVAYLMMSGQLATYGQSPSPAVPYAPQGSPGKW